MKKYYQISQKLKRNNVEIRHETVDEYLARGGQIKVIETVNFDTWEQIQRDRWAKKNTCVRRGNGRQQKRRSMKRIDEILGGGVL